MILYFKHIIHIDDFPLDGHPPSYITKWRRPICEKIGEKIKANLLFIDVQLFERLFINKGVYLMYFGCVAVLLCISHVKCY